MIILLSDIGYADPQPDRRAKPAPLDGIFPNQEYSGPAIGVPDSDFIYPMNRLLWQDFKFLKENKIKVYGWVNPSFNVSSSVNSNVPLSYGIVPNHIELDQLVVRAERNPDTVQTDHVDWGFRLTNLYGIDYRYTANVGYFSGQLLQQNHLYGYDPIEVYGQIYFPSVQQGVVVTVGRYISPPDIETQLAPQNYLVTHSLMFTYDAYTQTGINAAIKFNDTWSILVGLHSGNDVAPWTDAAHIPSLLSMIRWISQDNNDSLWGGIDSVNNAYFKGNANNFQEFNLMWTHRFTERFFIQSEAYYLYQFDAALGGTCNFGPIQSFGGGGGGCGPIIPGRSSAVGAVNYVEYKLRDKDYMSFRTDYLDDAQGQWTSFTTAYVSVTLGLTHVFSPLIELRPEVRYETAFSATPYDNGTKKNQTTGFIDGIVRF